MKFVVRDLKLGESLNGQVEEILSGDDLLINFGGDLLRVHNETRRPLRIGDSVTVVVRALEPLRFQLLEERSEQRRRGHLDLSV